MTTNKHLENVNPFLIHDKNGIICFDGPAPLCCYQYTLRELWREFPRGFVDVRLFMYKRCACPTPLIAKLTIYKQYAYIPWWDITSTECMFRLGYLFGLLAKITGQSICNNVLIDAIENMRLFLEKTEGGMNNYSNQLKIEKAI